MITDEQRIAQAKTLHPTYDNLYSAPQSGAFMADVYRRYQAPPELYPAFAQAVGDVILGFYTTAQLPQLLQGIGLPPQTAYQLVGELTSFLQPIFDREAGIEPEINPMEEDIATEQTGDTLVPDAVSKTSTEDELAELRAKFAATVSGEGAQNGPPPAPPHNSSMLAAQGQVVPPSADVQNPPAPAAHTTPSTNDASPRPPMATNVDTFSSLDTPGAIDTTPHYATETTAPMPQPTPAASAPNVPLAPQPTSNTVPPPTPPAQPQQSVQSPAVPPIPQQPTPTPAVPHEPVPPSNIPTGTSPASSSWSTSPVPEPTPAATPAAPPAAPPTPPQPAPAPELTPQAAAPAPATNQPYVRTMGNDMNRIRGYQAYREQNPLHHTNTPQRQGMSQDDLLGRSQNQ